MAAIQAGTAIGFKIVDIMSPIAGSIFPTLLSSCSSSDSETLALDSTSDAIFAAFSGVMPLDSAALIILSTSFGLSLKAFSICFSIETRIDGSDLMAPRVCFASDFLTSSRMILRS